MKDVDEYMSDMDKTIQCTGTGLHTEQYSLVQVLVYIKYSAVQYSVVQYSAVKYSKQWFPSPLMDEIEYMSDIYNTMHKYWRTESIDCKVQYYGSRPS